MLTRRVNTVSIFFNIYRSLKKNYTIYTKPRKTLIINKINSVKCSVIRCKKCKIEFKKTLHLLH